MHVEYPVITIDGPGGTGKGTIAQLLAEELSWNLLDSGALYRVLAHAAHQHSIDFDNPEGLSALAENLDVQFKASKIGQFPRVLFEGQDVSDEIRSEACGNAASTVSVLPEVRQALLQRQRSFCQAPGLVTDGRDMGTVIFPNAMLKIYLDASQEIRAQRRYKQLQKKGINVNLAAVAEEIAKRDERDMQRAVAPLKPAEDAICIDTTKMTIAEVFDQVLRAATRSL